MRPFEGRLRLAVSGSTALAAHHLLLPPGWRPDLGGCGLTESAAGSTVNRLDDVRIGTVGAGTEVRIAEDGEILLRGPSVMRGYHILPEQTADVLDADGWLRTGDIGAFRDGYLRITERKKDLFKTSGGKYIAPSEIEGRLKALRPFVGNAVVVGDGRNCCTALISLDASVLMPWAAEHGVPGKYADVAADPRTLKLVDGFVHTLNAGLQRWQTIKKFTLLPREMSIDSGELTPSLKVRRGVVAQVYEDSIAAMYAAHEPFLRRSRPLSARFFFHHTARRRIPMKPAATMWRVAGPPGRRETPARDSTPTSVPYALRTSPSTSEAPMLLARFIGPTVELDAEAVAALAVAAHG